MAPKTEVLDAFTLDVLKIVSPDTNTEKQLCTFLIHTQRCEHNEFPVNLDLAQDWLGYSCKWNIRRVVYKFKENKDYIVKPVKSNGRHGGHNKQMIWITLDTFEQIALRKSPSVRAFYIRIKEAFYKIKEDPKSFNKHKQIFTRIEKEKEGMLTKMEEERRCSFLKKKEHDDVCDEIAGQRGEREKMVFGGIADVVLEDTICEVKRANEWKTGVGQLYVYTSENNKRKHLHLLGPPCEEAIQFCRQKKIKLTHSHSQ